MNEQSVAGVTNKNFSPLNIYDAYDSFVHSLKLQPK